VAQLVPGQSIKNQPHANTCTTSITSNRNLLIRTLNTLKVINNKDCKEKVLQLNICSVASQCTNISSLSSIFTFVYFVFSTNLFFFQPHLPSFVPFLPFLSPSFLSSLSLFLSAILYPSGFPSTHLSLIPFFQTFSHPLSLLFYFPLSSHPSNCTYSISSFLLYSAKNCSIRTNLSR